MTNKLLVANLRKEQSGFAASSFFFGLREREVMGKKDFLNVFRRERRSEVVSVRLTPSEKAELVKNAERVGQNVSGYIVGMNRYVSDRILSERPDVCGNLVEAE